MDNKTMPTIKFSDLFCGIGGFRIGFENAAKIHGVDTECVFSSDIDEYAQQSYEANFGEKPFGDITTVNEVAIPDHDILFAGFPCQPFSIIGLKNGFNDIRGTLFFDIARILNEKQPHAFILENVKQLVGHDKGRTLKVILERLRGIGYNVEHKVLNALDYGLPQKRERVIIVGHKLDRKFTYPEPIGAFTPLDEILENEVDEKFYASDFIREKRKNAHQSKHALGIWHENKAGNVSSYPYSCALRAGASHNYLLVNGERRMTGREMLRLQGFPDSYKIAVNYQQIRKQAGNAVPVNLIQVVAERLIPFVLEQKERALNNKELIASNG